MTFLFSKAAARIACTWMCLASTGLNADNVEHVQKLNAITAAVVDLTSELAPALETDFVSWRKNITKSNAASIVRLIQENRIKGVPAEIGVLVCTGLSENDFATVMLPLLKANTEEGVLWQIIAPALPYGPGLCNTGRKGETRKVLSALKGNSQASFDLKASIEHVLSGAAAKDYSSFRKEPERFGYDREIVEKLATAPK